MPGLLAGQNIEGAVKTSVRLVRIEPVGQRDVFLATRFPLHPERATEVVSAIDQQEIRTVGLAADELPHIFRELPPEEGLLKDGETIENHHRRPAKDGARRVGLAADNVEPRERLRMDERHGEGLFSRRRSVGRPEEERLGTIDANENAVLLDGKVQREDAAADTAEMLGCIGEDAPTVDSD